jgi:hypothetical protein
MYSKLNIKDVINGHFDTVGKNDKKNSYRIEFVIIPLLLSLFFIIVKIPDGEVKNIFGICLSILTGLYLNILVLLISSISSDNLSIAIKHKKIRLELLKETLYNVSYSVVVSVKALIVLFASTILTFKIDSIDNLLLILIERDLNFIIQFILGFFLYKYTIDIFLILFMILKRINVLYTKEIYIEKLKLNNLENNDSED